MLTASVIAMRTERPELRDFIWGYKRSVSASDSEGHRDCIGSMACQMWVAMVVASMTKRVLPRKP